METEKGQITRIYNGEIITPERNFGVGTVLIAEGKIIGIEPGNYEVNPEKPDVPLNKNDAFQKVQKRRVQEKR